MIDVFPRTVCTIPWVGIVSFASFDNLFSQAGFLGDYLYATVCFRFVVSVLGGQRLQRILKLDIIESYATASLSAVRS